MNGFSLFANLLQQLLFCPSRNGKIANITEYLREASAGDRGYALAILTGSLKIQTLRAAQLKGLAKQKVDPVLFQLSSAYVGDLGETIALIWPSDDPEADENLRPESLVGLVKRVKGLSPLDIYPYLDRVLGALTEVERWAFVKLVTGGSLRIGVSARLAKVALAKCYERKVDDVEKLWSACEPPYDPLFEWLDGETEALPAMPHKIYFHPMHLAHPLDEKELEKMNPANWLAEWKWDGIRVEVVCDGETTRVFSRTGDDISEAFPDLIAGWKSEGVVDGELLIRKDSLEAVDDFFARVGTFNELQQRLNRKKVSADMLSDFPVFLCAYDLLLEGAEDIRALPFEARRKRLESFVDQLPGVALSPLVEFEAWEELRDLRMESRARDLEGLMLKRRDSGYFPGRQKGLWYKWKRDPLIIDTVMMYAQRGHGKRASYYSDYTFGVWSAEGELVPVGKAYSGFSDEELQQLDKWVRDNTTERYGASVRKVKSEMVLEVKFDDVQRSGRHRSGVAMRFPRINRLRWDKPAKEADTLEGLLELGGIEL